MGLVLLRLMHGHYYLHRSFNHINCGAKFSSEKNYIWWACSVVLYKSQFIRRSLLPSIFLAHFDTLAPALWVFVYIWVCRALGSSMITAGALSRFSVRFRYIFASLVDATGALHMLLCGQRLELWTFDFHVLLFCALTQSLWRLSHEATPPNPPLQLLDLIMFPHTSVNSIMFWSFFHSLYSPKVLWLLLPHVLWKGLVSILLSFDCLLKGNVIFVPFNFLKLVWFCCDFIPSRNFFVLMRVHCFVFFDGAFCSWLEIVLSMLFVTSFRWLMIFSFVIFVHSSILVSLKALTLSLLSACVIHMSLILVSILSPNSIVSVLPPFLCFPKHCSIAPPWMVHYIWA